MINIVSLDYLGLGSREVKVQFLFAGLPLARHTSQRALPSQQRHQQGTKCSDTQICAGHFPLKSPHLHESLHVPLTPPLRKDSRIPHFLSFLTSHVCEKCMEYKTTPLFMGIPWDITAQETSVFQLLKVPDSLNKCFYALSCLSTVSFI